MTRTFRFISLLVAAAFTLVLSGCKTPILGGGRYDPTDYPTVRPATPGVGDMGATTVVWDPPPSDDWQDMETSLVDTTVPAGVQERRWEGVAVYFAYDRSTIGASERVKVEKLADYLLERLNYYVIVEGHCDERGSDEYNRALGERRALAVKDYLVALGVAADRIRTLSYGEERPAVADATTESQHSQNRRAEFVLGITP